MISRYTYHGLTWVDLESPTREEVLHITEEFSLPQLVGEELYSTTLRSKVDLYEHFIFLILHFPIDRENDPEKTEQEIDFIIGRDFILTVRYELIDPVHEFAKIFEVNSLLDRERITTHGGFIFMEMMKQFYKSSLRELEEVTRTIKMIEHRIFSDNEESMVRTISLTSRKLLDFKQAIRFHRDILVSYESASRRFFGEDYAYYASAITAEYNKVNSVLESNRDVLAELQRTNDSLLSTKQNDTMKTLTVMSFVMLPLTLITGVFGMNTIENLIFIQSLGDFFLVIGAMTLTAFVMFFFFKLRKWF
jgi:magnesium transporter